MSHPQQRQFIKSISECLSNQFLNRNILEIGSYSVNGSIRQYFEDSNYCGVDLTEGPCVDVVCEGDKLEHADEYYDLSISCECFEHNPNWAETFENMWRMTKKGGVVTFTCATTGRAEHGTTRTSIADSPGTQLMKWDYYRNLTESDFSTKFRLNEMFSSHYFYVNENSCDLYFYGVRAGGENIFNIDTSLVRIKSIEFQNKLQLEIKNRKKREKFIPRPLRPFFRNLFHTQQLRTRQGLVDEF